MLPLTYLWNCLFSIFELDLHSRLNIPRFDNRPTITYLRIRQQSCEQ